MGSSIKWSDFNLSVPDGWLVNDDHSLWVEAYIGNRNTESVIITVECLHNEFSVPKEDWRVYVRIEYMGYYVYFEARQIDKDRVRSTVLNFAVLAEQYNSEFFGWIKQRDLVSRLGGDLI